PEGEQWLRRVEQVAPPGGGLGIIEHRQLPHVAGDGDGQLAAGIDVAKQGRRHGGPGFLSEIPPIENGGDSEREAWDRQRAAVNEHQDGARAGGEYRAWQLLLLAPRPELGAV